MGTGNPFTDVPTLRPKEHHHSRSLSRSPTRQYARDFDPLLRDLSPSATLRAFVTDPGDMSGQAPDALTRSIQTSSASERALGAKAAQACLDLREWTRELQAWEWPGTFETPEPVRRKRRANDNEEEVYWGSLPAKTVQACEERADEIGHDLDQIDVEELKDYVLSSHYRAESRPQSSDAPTDPNATSTTDVKKLDDYTAIVTATILHALPYISQLNRLLDTWTIRLIILRGVPAFLRDLRQARKDLDNAWAALSPSFDLPTDADRPTAKRASFNRYTMQEVKSTLGSQMISLGRRLDRFLDNLEGRDDALPDGWIGDFEILEAAYGTWVAQAERKVLENEWHEEDAPDEALPNAISELEDPNSDDDAVRRVSLDARELQVDPLVHEPSTKAVSNESDVAPKAMTDSSSIPVLIASDYTEASAVENSDMEPALARMPSSGSISKEDEMGQVARRRAQFLNGIERQQSLNMSKSPVRPFEHASNAFTRLFKKDRSPEHAKPKRTTSNKWGPNGGSDQRTASAPLSPVSVASSNFNTASLSSVHSAGTSSRTSRVGSAEAEAEAVSSKSTLGTVDATESHEEPAYYGPEHYREITDILRDSNPSSALSSPFHSPKKQTFPQDAPDVSKVDTPQEETVDASEAKSGSAVQNAFVDVPEPKTREVEICSDVFDRVFIEALPNGTPERPRSAHAAAEPKSESKPRKRQSMPANPRGQLGDVPQLPSSSSREQVPGTSPKQMSEVDSSTGLDYFRTAETATSAGGGSFDRQTTNDPRALKLDIPAEESIEQEEAYEDRPRFLKRASTASIETFSRSQLKTIDVPRSSRRSSVSTSAVTTPQTPPWSRHNSVTSRHNSVTSIRNVADPTDADPMSYKGMVVFPTPPANRLDGSGRATPPPSSSSRETPSKLQRVRDQSPGRDQAGESPRGDENTSPAAPLNAAMAKRRAKSALKVENSPTAARSSPSKLSHQRNAEEDTFDRHVSEVLETLPGRIRFTSRPGAETPSLQSGDARGYNGPRPKANPNRPPKGTEGITIAPASAYPAKSSSSAEPEVKLYHLTTSGRDEPIKLFVRLVGEGERVMVRVGGGWADLADYLRQYAEHHGSRTVSEGNFEVQTVTSSPLTRKVSNPAEYNRAKSPALLPNGTPRPSSKDSEQDWPFNTLFGGGGSTPNGATPGRQTPAQSSTPKSSSGSSRPSTANASRPPSRQNTGDVGLAGPSSGKKSALPEQKAKWVEGMIERAKQASAEKSKDDKQKYFSELGKAGATRRVFFRSTSNGEAPR